MAFVNTQLSASCIRTTPRPVCSTCKVQPNNISQVLLQFFVMLLATPDKQHEQTSVTSQHQQQHTALPYRGEHVLEPFLYKLMRSANQLEAIDLIELSSNSGSKEPAGASGADCPGLCLFRITPHEIAERPLMRNLTHALYCSYLHAPRLLGFTYL